jgi:hypothetical protein
MRCYSNLAIHPRVRARVCHFSTATYGCLQWQLSIFMFQEMVVLMARLGGRSLTPSTTTCIAEDLL